MRSPRAVVVGIIWFSALVALAVWFLASTGYPHLIIFLSPWAVPGVLLALWGARPASGTQA